MNLIEIKNEINKKLGDKETFTTLLETTFKGLDPQVAKRAMLEGAMRGFTFDDFLAKNVYAIPFKNSYSLVTSVDYARKKGMRSGVVGSLPPVYEMTEDGKTILSCTVTIKRKVDDYIGEYSATVFFSEYYKAGYNGQKSLWDLKPRTMIAKVAEMHALRKACPEELAQSYLEEEYQETSVVTTDDSYKAEVDAIETVEELKTYYQANKGKGKDFDKYVTARKALLQQKHENT